MWSHFRGLPQDIEELQLREVLIIAHLMRAYCLGLRKIPKCLYHTLIRNVEIHCWRNPKKVVVNYHATWWMFWNYFQLFFYNGAQWARFPMGRNLKIQNHRILDICLEIISAKFGWSRSKINKIKTSDILLIKPIYMYKLWKMVQWLHPCEISCWYSISSDPNEYKWPINHLTLFLTFNVMLYCIQFTCPGAFLEAVIKDGLLWLWWRPFFA